MEKKQTILYLIIIIVLIIILGVLWFLIIKSNTQNTNYGISEMNNTSVTYSSAKEITKDENVTAGEYSSTNKDENAISVSGNIKSTLSNITVKKTGDSMVLIQQL